VLWCWICISIRKKNKLRQVESAFYDRALVTSHQTLSLSECNCNHFLVTIFLTCNTEPKSKNHSLYSISLRLVSLFLLFTDRSDDFLGNIRILITVICPFLQVVVQIANSFNFYCSHQSFCHPFCYRRHMRACSRLMKSVRRVRVWTVPAILAKDLLLTYHFLSLSYWLRVLKISFF
jgi:hypothetical protein